MEINSKQLKKRGGLFVAIGCLLIIFGNAITFTWPTTDFWRGFIHGFSVVANLCGIIFLVYAWRCAKREGRLLKEEESEALSSGEETKDQ